MKTRLRRNNAANIPASRWLSYSAASAATILTGAVSADAEIHYSGRIDTVFPPDQEKTESFSLGQPGAFIAFEHALGGDGVGRVYFQVHASANEGFIGTYIGFEYGSVSRLAKTGGYVSQGHFIAYEFGTMVRGNRGFYLLGQWKARGIGFVGFRFNTGAGIQYGWARVEMGGKTRNFGFKVLDYAYADPEESIATGQTSSSETRAEGSLGLLALGATGVALWRQRRRLAAA